MECHLCQLLDTDLAEGFRMAHEHTKNGHIKIVKVCVILRDKGHITELTKYCMSWLRDDTEEAAFWQEYVLERALETHPYLAELVFKKNLWTRFDRDKIGKNFFNKGFHQHALRCFNKTDDIIMVIRNIHAISEDFLIEYFNTLPNYIV